MRKASQLQKGNIVQINGQPYQVRQIDVHTPSARGANTLYKLKLSNVVTGQKIDQTFKGTDALEEMELERRASTFLYRDAETFHFMDSENFEQYALLEDHLEGQSQWLVENMEGIVALLLNGQAIGIELPATVDLEIVETVPAIKGATATNRNKPATLSNGAVVMVPEYLASGEVIRINTETARFMCRARG